jgi:ABC-type lipoprotein release transport system permease subunit
MIQLFKLALRNLGRNRRRSFFSALALGIGLALLMLMAAFVEGEMGSAIDLAIRLQSGHLQVRAASYDETKGSLKWQDLIENPEQLAAQVAALPQVRVATPRLFASGFVAVRDSSTGVRVWGIDPASPANEPYRQGLLSGEFLKADDRQGILIGLSLADRLKLKPGDTLTLSINTSSGDIVEQPFTVRGIFTTGTASFDRVTVLLPLSKAQTMAQAENHASTIFILLSDKSQADAVAQAIQTPNYKVLTWLEMNELIMQTEEMASGYMVFLYLIVLVITATVTMNALIMAVFERTREIGILAAIGMKGRRIMAMFLAESTLLATGGIILGILLGLLIVGYFTRYGFYIGEFGINTFYIANRIYTKLTVEDTLNLVALSFIITLLAGVYPALMAARMEPVEALRGGE